MNPTAILKLESEEQSGVKVTFTLLEGETPIQQVEGKLPSFDSLQETYQHWQNTYRALIGAEARLGELEAITDGSSNAQHACQQSAQTLQQKLNQWLQAPEFAPIRETWRQALDPEQPLRVILQTNCSLLQRLPWHLWELLDQEYPQAEIALSNIEPKASPTDSSPSPPGQVRLLAILGNSYGINIEEDRALLNELPHAEVTFLAEPNRQELGDQLWDQPWDILFFAGHSRTEGKSGRIFINDTDSLTMEELRYGLRQAVGKGLQLAIFNSCDGLGIAQELEQLNIPQTIVMREPVPDHVAQGFLRYFLNALALGKPLYPAVREARERLQGVEDALPTASWLPILVQKPSATPPSWRDLVGPMPPSPYKGLETFQLEDASFFFGRDSYIQKLITAVKNQPLVAVLGASGSGKSSLVLAGLVPELVKQEKVKVVYFRPKINPFQELAIALDVVLTPNLSQADDQEGKLAQMDSQITLEQELRQDEKGLCQKVAEITQAYPNQRLLLIADQFEELYTQTEISKEERQKFLDCVIYAVKYATSSLSVVLTLRADFSGVATQYRPFCDVFQDRTIWLGPMEETELRATIERPAALRGVGLESGLTTKLVKAVGNDPGRLPLLEFTLNQLWQEQEWKDGVGLQLTHRAYDEKEKVGGVEQALANHAEQVYSQLIAEFGGEIAQRLEQIFLNLVIVGEEGQITRRLATRPGIGETNWELVNRLADERLATTNRPQGEGVETVEMIHDTLPQQWERLHFWVEQNQDFLRWRKRLKRAMEEYQHHGKLLEEASLPEALGWQKIHSLEQAEHDFINESQQYRRNQKRKRWAWVSVVIAVLAGLSGFATLNWQRAEKQETLANQRTVQSLENEAESLFALNKPLEAMLASVKAGQLRMELGEKNVAAQLPISPALLQSAYYDEAFNQGHSYGYRINNQLEGHSDDVRDVTFSPNGQFIATASLDGTIKLWSKEGELLQTLGKHSHGVTNVAFSPDSTIIASASHKGMIKLWNRQGELLQTLGEQSHSVTKVIFSPDGEIIASANHDGTIKLWSIKGELLHSWRGHGLPNSINDIHLNVAELPYGLVSNIKFSSSSQILVTAGGHDGTIKLWNRKGELLHRLKHDKYKTYRINQIELSPSGNIIASASDHGIIKLWNPEGKLLHTIEGHYPVDSHTYSFNIAFSPNGKILASVGGKEGIIKLWSREGELLDTLEEDSSRINAVDFSPYGQIFAFRTEGTVRVWSKEEQSSYLSYSPHHTLEADTNGINRVEFSPDGEFFTSVGSFDRTIEIWSRGNDTLHPLEKQIEIPTTKFSFSSDGQLLASVSLHIDGTSGRVIELWNRDGKLLHTLEKHSGSVTDVQFSPDGQHLVSADDQGEIKRWTREGELLDTIKAHTARITDLEFSPDGEAFASASWDNTIRLWSLEGNLLHTLEKHSDSVTDIEFSTDGQFIASASVDTTIKQWSSEGKLLETIEKHTATVTDIEFKPHGQRLVSADDQGNIKRWNREGELLDTLEENTVRVTDIEFSPDGETFASATGEGTIKLWSQEGQLLYSFKGTPSSASMDTNIEYYPDKKLLASVSSGKIQLWPTKLETLHAWTCNWLKNYLTHNASVTDEDREASGCFE